jgi:hypothetical protein
MSMAKAVQKELEIWIAAKRALKVARRLMPEQPENTASKVRLQQSIATEKEAAVALRAALRTHGYSDSDLQAQLRRSIR